MSKSDTKKFSTDKDYRIFFTSDTHFNHSHLVEKKIRPFSSVEHMNQEMIMKWNELIKKDDIVFHAGDFALGNAVNCEKVLQSLNGKIHLCIGSHDSVARNGRCKKYFSCIRDSFMLKIDDQYVFVAHHCHKVWPSSHYGSWHIHGHSHGGLDKYDAGEGKILDVGVDPWDFRPVRWREIVHIMNSRPDNFNLIKNKLQKGHYNALG